MSTSWRNKSHALYSRGSSCIGKARISQNVANVRRALKTCIERIILAHFPNKLILDPAPNLRVTGAIQPAQPLNFSDNPFLFTLLSKDPPETSVISTAPESKVEQEENVGCSARQNSKKI